jgi:outer membrane protein
MRLPHAVLAGLLAAAGPAFAGTPLPNPVGPYPDNTLPTDEPDHVPHTLADALGIAYETNPTLTGERAHLRSTDENLPQALAGWRPTVTVTAADGFSDGRQDQSEPCTESPGQNNNACYKNGMANPNYKPPPSMPFAPNPNFVQTNSFINSQLASRNLNAETATVTEYLYRGGKTAASTHEADNSIYAERARLIAQEEQVLLNGITAYVTYVEDTQLLELNVQNEQVLGDELRAVSDRYRVGELTRTDVAQAEAALAAAIAQRETAEGNLQTAAATFYYDIGINLPKDLADPQPLRLPVHSEKEAWEVAESNNPTVVAALFNQSQMKDAIDVAFAALGPQIYLQGQGFQQVRTSLAGFTSYGFQGTINLSLPLYQGGSEYSEIRQARQNYQQAVRQTENAVSQAHEQAVAAWDTLIAARAAVDSSRIAVRSAQIAVEGTERQALVGSATTQDVLIQQQNLLSAQITLVQNVTSVVTSSYTVANAIGRLTAKDLGLAVPLYDETAYYNAVKNKLWGTGDYAVHEPGR